MIIAEPQSRTAAVSGAALTKDEARVTVLGVPDVPGTSLTIFSAIAARKIAVDMVVQNVGSEGRADISFTVPGGELSATLEALREPAKSLGSLGVTHDSQVSKVSVVGLGMASQTGVASRMFRALADANVNIQMISTSEIKISALVPRDQAVTALRAIHAAFGLDVAPKDSRSWTQIRADRADETDVDAIVSLLRDDALEELTLTDINVTGNQARVTLAGVPDVPGIAADVFETIGKAGIFIDMIVQGYDGEDGSTSISFTTSEQDLEKSLLVASQISTRHKMRGAQGARAIAKITVSGIGLRSHTQVGTILFKTLSDAGINVQMINTSELQVNAVIDAERSKDALKSVQTAFAQSLQPASGRP